MVKEEVIKIINSYWATIPQEKLPTYDDFNCVIPVDENRPQLRQLETEQYEIGIANFGTNFEGITTLAFIATITDLLGGFRLAAVLESATEDKPIKDRKIIGWKPLTEE